MPGAHHTGHPHGLGWHVHRGNKAIDTKSKIIILLFNTLVLTFLISFELLILFGFLLLLLTFIYKAKILGIVKKFIVTSPLLLSLTILAYFAYPNQGILSFGKTAKIRTPSSSPRWIQRARRCRSSSPTVFPPIRYRGL